jgi:hypothetical protein
MINQQFKELNEKYPELQLIQSDSELWRIRGILHFAGEYQNQVIDDRFSVEIFIPDDYPDTPPSVWETENKIPQNFHHYQNKSLCLGAPLAVRLAFKENPTLLGFTETCLIPYLYGFSYKSKYGDMPYGELAHGRAGLFEYYQIFFEVDNRQSVLEFLEILTLGRYRGHAKCPCGSNKRIRILPWK